MVPVDGLANYKPIVHGETRHFYRNDDNGAIAVGLPFLAHASATLQRLTQKTDRFPCRSGSLNKPANRFLNLVYLP